MYCPQWDSFLNKQKCYTRVLRHLVFEICVTIKLGTKLFSCVTCHNDKSTVLGVPKTHSAQLGSVVIGLWNTHLANHVASSKPLVSVTV